MSSDPSLPPAMDVGDNAPPIPSYRSLQIYAFDPSLDLDLELARVNRSILSVDWEDGLQPGPVGEYVEVVDVDPASQQVYRPVDLNHPHLLASNGYPPSEGNPQFHQQMVYAVTMKTIGNFELALGRSVHWAPRIHDENGKGLRGKDSYVRRLRIYPHALREANAYYSPDKRALLFGYFNAQNVDAREGLPGGIVFSCLSHDVVAHEATHAILDGIHRRMLEATNPDSLAFHEAFADLVAIFQHFTLPRVLESQITYTRGNLSAENLLAKLAVQFGRATRAGNALRDALGAVDPTSGQWERTKPDPLRISRVYEPHARGAILVAAIFDAFLAIYHSHTADLLRIASGGSGRLPDGAIHPDLVKRLAAEAEKVAQRILIMCIRALDYLPPVDVTYGDFVRGLITGDSDLVVDDKRNYRVAIIRSFRDWGIYPRDVRALSVDSLRWKPPTREEQELLRRLLPSLEELRTIASSYVFTSGQEELLGRIGEDRDELIEVQEVADRLVKAYQQASQYPSSGRNPNTANAEPSIAALQREHEFLRDQQLARYVHDRLADNARTSIAEHERKRLTEIVGIDFFNETARFEVHAVRPAVRVRPDGRTKTELLILITQRIQRSVALDDSATDPSTAHYKFRGGCTLLIDPDSGDVKYAITKGISSAGRQRRQDAYLKDRLSIEGLSARGQYRVWLNDEVKTPQEPFRLLHRGTSWDEE